MTPLAPVDIKIGMHVRWHERDGRLCLEGLVTNVSWIGGRFQEFEMKVTRDYTHDCHTEWTTNVTLKYMSSPYQVTLAEPVQTEPVQKELFP